MVVGIKDGIKLAGIAIIACCAVFVCTLFLNYNFDLPAIEGQITSQAGMVMYQAQLSMGKVVCGVSGGCLVITSAVMLLFYVKNYIDVHSKEMGILKALGYADRDVAKCFWVFGLSVFIGCALGFCIAFLYLPAFYEIQNSEGLFPQLDVGFHPLLAFSLVGVPAMAFMALSVFFAYLRLKSPVTDLLKDKREYQYKPNRREVENLNFLCGLRRATLRSRKSRVFFMAFSAFCFSAMLQMAMSMRELASEAMAFIMISIGLILAFTTLLLSFSSVIKENTKTMAMMKVFGYQQRACSRALLSGYRPVAYIGFALGTGYQYGLLKIMVAVVFSDLENMPEYHFDFKALIFVLILFLVSYELSMYGYSLRIRKLSIKSIMLE